MSGDGGEARTRLLDQFLDAVLDGVAKQTIDGEDARNSLRKAISLAYDRNPGIEFFLEQEIARFLGSSGGSG